MNHNFKKSHKKKKHKEKRDIDANYDHEKTYKQPKEKKNFESSNNLNVLESESSLSNRLNFNSKKKKYIEELEDSEISVDSKRIKKKKRKFFNESKDSEKHEVNNVHNHEIISPNLQLKDDGLPVSDNLSKTKGKKSRESKYSNASGFCEFVETPENDRITEKNVSGDHEVTQELCDRKTKKNKITFHQKKSATSENSYEKESGKNGYLSVLESEDKIDNIVFDDLEDPESFQIPPLHESEALTPLTKDQKDAFVSQGIVIKQGKFSSSEDAIIRENLKGFCSTFKVDDPLLLLGIGRGRKPDPALFKILKAKHFNVRLARNLNDRTLSSVYQRARTLFDPFRNKKMKCHEEEIKEIKYHQMKVGNSWSKIGSVTNKTCVKVRKCFEWNNKDIKKGDWTAEEENMLTSAIESLVCPNLSGRDSKRIPWSEVAKLVPSRNASQCRLHWGECLSWEPDSKRLPWTKEKDAQLVDELISRKNIIVDDIDWEDIHKLFLDHAPSHMFLRKRFRKLKSIRIFRNMLEESGLPLE